MQNGINKKLYGTYGYLGNKRNLIEKCLHECIQEICQHGKKINLRKGCKLDHKNIYYLEKGKCVLCVTDARGDILSVSYFRTGQLLAFMPLLLQFFPMENTLLEKKIPTSMFKIKALTGCSLILLDKDYITDNFLNNASLPCLFLQSAMTNIISMYMSIYNSPILSNAQRICSLILFSLEDNDNHIPRYLTHAEISNHLSIHIITVSKILARLKHIGIIEKKGTGFIISDIKTLKNIAHGLITISY